MIVQIIQLFSFNKSWDFNILKNCKNDMKISENLLQKYTLNLIFADSKKKKIYIFK